MKKLVVWLHALQFILDGKKHEFVEASSQQSITRRPQNEIKTKQNAMWTAYKHFRFMQQSQLHFGYFSVDSRLHHIASMLSMFAVHSANRKYRACIDNETIKSDNVWSTPNEKSSKQASPFISCLQTGSFRSTWYWWEKRFTQESFAFVEKLSSVHCSDFSEQPFRALTARFNRKFPPEKLWRQTSSRGKLSGFFRTFGWKLWRWKIFTQLKLSTQFKHLFPGSEW